MTFGARYKEYKELIEKALARCLPDGPVPHQRLIDSMRYSLGAGGKRIRPVLTLAFCQAAGGEVTAALPAACAAEMIHTYSLIHDDLPCMDDDELRRGKPTNHVVFGETTAVLAGDALQSLAFYTLLSSPLPPRIAARCGGILAEAAGENGMCAGQLLDTQPRQAPPSEEELLEIHKNKTARMIIASCHMGVAAARGGEAQCEAAREYARCIGLAFQIRDDVLDVSGDTEKTGKPAGSDAKNQKSTFATLYGQEKCRRLIGDLTEEAKGHVRGVFSDPWFLCEMADWLSARDH